MSVTAGTIAAAARAPAQANDRLAGIDTDHKQIVASIMRLIDDLERRPPSPPDT